MIFLEKFSSLQTKSHKSKSYECRNGLKNLGFWSLSVTRMVHFVFIEFQQALKGAFS